MEISEKSNFRFKALVIALVATILASTCSTAFGFSVFNMKVENEAFLNRKVEFTGDTHYYSDGSGKKISIFKKGETVRKTYTAEKPGCGIITLIKEGAKYPFYVTGEGWIEESQMINIKRFITLDINTAENEKGKGLTSSLLIDGEYTTVKSDNTAVVDYKDGVLTANGDGKTTVTIKPGNGKEDIELLAVVADGNIELNIPEKTVSAELTQGNVSMFDDKVEVKATAGAQAALKIEDGQVSIEAKKLDNKEEMAKVELFVAGDKKAEIDMDGEVTVTASMEKVTAEVKANQKLTILDKLALKLKENASATVDKKHVEAEAGAGIYKDDDSEIASASAGVQYEYGAEDPTGSAKVSVLEKTLVEKNNERIPVISGLKALMAKVR